MKILSFAGRAGSGKDTISDFLVRSGVEFGLGKVKKYGWADPMKNFVHQFYGIPKEWLWGSNEDKNRSTHIKWWNLPHASELTDKFLADKDGCLTVRQLLQQVGTEVIRRMDTEAHVRATLYLVHEDNPDLAVICDTRFPNEVGDGVQKSGGKVVRLTRNAEVPATHESETALDKANYDWNRFDAILDNANMTIHQQNEGVINLLRGWGWTKNI